MVKPVTVPVPLRSTQPLVRSEKQRSQVERGGTKTFWHELKPSDMNRAKRGVRVRPVWNEKRVGAVTDIKYFEVIK